MMQTSVLILANTPNIYGALFWLVIAAAIIWLLIWRLLRSDSVGNVTVSSSPDAESQDQPTEKTAAKDSPDSPAAESASAGKKPPPLPKTSPPPIPTAESESTHPPVIAPSQAFTIWTKPGPSPAAEKEPKAEPEAADAGPVLDTATAEEAAAQFQEDLDSGEARQDEALGILYDSEPEGADDLREIKGVGKVLEGKLHDFGIYKHKQIAFWTDTAVAEFAQRLTFKDRIYRDDWIAQAKKLHEKKYGEKF